VISDSIVVGCRSATREPCRVSLPQGKEMPHPDAQARDDDAPQLHPTPERLLFRCERGHEWAPGVRGDAGRNVHEHGQRHPAPKKRGRAMVHARAGAHLVVVGRQQGGPRTRHAGEGRHALVVSEVSGDPLLRVPLFLFQRALFKSRRPSRFALGDTPPHSTLLRKRGRVAESAYGNTLSGGVRSYGPARVDRTPIPATVQRCAAWGLSAAFFFVRGIK